MTCLLSWSWLRGWNWWELNVVIAMLVFVMLQTFEALASLHTCLGIGRGKIRLNL